MLAMFGLLGAVMAGMLADSLSATTDDRAEGDDSDDPALDESPDLHGHGDLLDDPDPAEPVSDAPLPEAPLSQGLDAAIRPPLGNGDGGLILQGSAAGDLLSGGAGNDLIHGDGGADQIDARDGNDTLFGSDGNDIIRAGAGADTAYGGAGADTLHGEGGADLMFGGTGDDHLAGQEEADSLLGGEGADTLLGGGGDDSLEGDAGDDWLAGGYGGDWLNGGAGTDTLDGGDGADTLWGIFPEGPDDLAADFLNGGDGDDLLHLGAGDHAMGGAGADSFLLSHWLGDGGPALIGDYDAAEDQIVVVYDAAQHLDPQLVLEPAEGATRILLDGALLATVNGSLDLADLQLLAA